jgi:hypothetical protein
VAVKSALALPWHKAVMTDAPSLALPPTPQPQARQWREAFARLSATTPPCPGVNLKKWPEMHTVALQFLSDHADRAADLGWTTEELLGVHPVVGAVRVDACSALMVSGGQPMVAVERDRIRFGLTSYYHAKGKVPSVPVWDWREPKQR